VASCSKNATIELRATECRVGEEADGLARNVIGQGNEAAAMIEVALLMRSFLEDGGQGELSGRESLLRFKKAAGERMGKRLRCTKRRKADDQIAVVAEYCCCVVLGCSLMRESW
jgi:hypothetical protein